MDEQKVRDAVKVTNDLIGEAKANPAIRLWELVFNALTYDPITLTPSREPSNIERFLSAVGGPCQAITVKQTDPEFFGKLCAQFGVTFDKESK